jgi:hypothetical protein
MMSASACSSRLSIEMFGAPRERERDRERERERRKPGPPASSCRCSCLSLACWFSLPKSQYLIKFNYLIFSLRFVSIIILRTGMDMLIAVHRLYALLPCGFRVRVVLQSVGRKDRTA